VALQHFREQIPQEGLILHQNTGQHVRSLGMGEWLLELGQAWNQVISMAMSQPFYGVMVA
jgi:hypothetical protein